MAGAIALLVVAALLFMLVPLTTGRGTFLVAEGTVVSLDLGAVLDLVKQKLVDAVRGAHLLPEQPACDGVAGGRPGAARHRTAVPGSPSVG